MNSPPAATLDAQEPTREHLPSGITVSSGDAAVELAASCGLHLDPWQQRVLVHALGERADGLWGAFRVCLVVPRQNGKGSILEALELAALFIFRERLVVHSAHEFRTAREHFRRMCTLIARSDDLSAKVAGRIHTANGNESIETEDGSRLMFVARSRGAARGFTCDRLVLDEAFNLSHDAMGAMLPALSAVPNPQVWLTSSAPHADSLVLHDVRDEGLKGEDPRLYFAEWGNPRGTEPTIEAIARANPGYPHRISHEFVLAERNALGALGNEFPRERLGVPDARDAGATVFGPGKWAACGDPTSTLATCKALALDVSPGFEWASFAAAGAREDGLVHAELIQRHPGTDWVVQYAKERAERWQLPIGLVPNSPAGGLISDLEEAGVPLVMIEGNDVTQACATLQKAVMGGSFRHLDQPPVNAAVAAAATSEAGDTWRWARKSAQADISSLCAVTWAHWLAVQPGKHIFAY